MKFRQNKIKREHSIIDGALDWLVDLSKNREVTAIIPGVINVTNSKERGIVYKYETATGCKLFLKNDGSIQEAFVVTKNPSAVEAWVGKIMAELELMQAALADTPPKGAVLKEEPKAEKKKSRDKTARRPAAGQEKPLSELPSREGLLSGFKKQYKLVEINQGLRDSFVDSLATMADLENPKIEDTLAPEVLQALAEHFKERKN